MLRHDKEYFKHVYCVLVIFLQDGMLECKITLTGVYKTMAFRSCCEIYENHVLILSIYWASKFTVRVQHIIQKYTHVDVVAPWDCVHDGSAPGTVFEADNVLLCFVHVRCIMT